MATDYVGAFFIILIHYELLISASEGKCNVQVYFLSCRGV